jgi:hypothetical protein
MKAPPPPPPPPPPLEVAVGKENLSPGTPANTLAKWARYWECNPHHHHHHRHHRQDKIEIEIEKMIHDNEYD